MEVKWMFFKRDKLKKADMKYMAKWLYNDVSPDEWDQQHLTKDNLDFSVPSVRIVDEYVKRLMTTEIGQKLLLKHLQNFTKRLGAYIGEVIRNGIDGDYKWYDCQSIQEHTIHLQNYVRVVNEESVLYSKKLDRVICPIFEVSQYLNGKSNYKMLLNYVEEVIDNEHR